jgi:hypothetical protein
MECRKLFRVARNARPEVIFARAKSKSAESINRTPQKMKSGWYDSTVVRLQCKCGRHLLLTDAQILSEAGRIAVSRRKVHAGPTRTFTCECCGAACRGHKGLSAHRKVCDNQPSGDPVPLTEADLRALAWPDS